MKERTERTITGERDKKKTVKKSVMRLNSPVSKVVITIIRKIIQAGTFAEGVVRIPVIAVKRTDAIDKVKQSIIKNGMTAAS